MPVRKAVVLAPVRKPARKAVAPVRKLVIMDAARAPVRKPVIMDAAPDGVRKRNIAVGRAVPRRKGRGLLAVKVRALAR